MLPFFGGMPCSLVSSLARCTRPDGSRETAPLSFQTTFGQLNMHVEVPSGPIDELTHLPLIEQEVLEGMKTEMSAAGDLEGWGHACRKMRAGNWRRKPTSRF